MKIELDALMKEYLVRVLGSLSNELDLDRVIGSPDTESMARLTIRILQCAVVQGAANHRYRSSQGIDEFTCTGRLIKHWTWLFHEERPTDSEHRFIVRLKGSRSRYFTPGWRDTDPANPPPVWPNEPD
jgi:hypothetical protein